VTITLPPATTPTAEPPPPPPRRPPASKRLGDRVFSGLSTGAGVLILVVLAAVALFLVTESIPALTADGEELPGGEGFLRYLAPLLFGTILAAVLALLFALPLSVGIALFISHYAPAGSPGRWATSRTCSPPSRASSTGSGARWSWRPTSSRPTGGWSTTSASCRSSPARPPPTAARS
jgi:hypothetical protein